MSETLNPLSACCAPIALFHPEGQVPGTATCFFHSRSDKFIFVVTNWHVVTGRDPSNPTHSKTGAIPTKLKLTVHEKINGDRLLIHRLVEIDVDLNDRQGDDPKWLEHPRFRHHADVVVVPIPITEDFLEKINCRFVTELKSNHASYFPAPMDDVFVVGYPFGLTGGSEVLPLYKRGSVASEPLIDLRGMPLFLIDCRTSEAMSGSPVIAAPRGLWFDEHGAGVSGVQRFAGVYSGRLVHRDTHGAKEISEIGQVWKSEIIDEIIAGGSFGTKVSALTAKTS